MRDGKSKKNTQTIDANRERNVGNQNGGWQGGEEVSKKGEYYLKGRVHAVRIINKGVLQSTM